MSLECERVVCKMIKKLIETAKLIGEMNRLMKEMRTVENINEFDKLAQEFDKKKNTLESLG